MGNRKNEDNRFHSFDFTMLPRIGEEILLQDFPGGGYKVKRIVYEIIKGVGRPIVVMQKAEIDFVEIDN
jgi:hypothetical protein